MKRALSVLTAVTLVMFLLIACSTGGNGGNKEPEPEPTPTPAPKQETPAAETPTVEDNDEEVIDLNGRTIKFVHFWDGTPKGGSPMGDLAVKRWKDIEKKYNVVLEWVNIPADDIAPQFAAAAMAGSTIGDIVIMRAEWAFPSLVSKGYLLPLDEYIDTKQSHFYQPATEFATYDGKSYGFVNWGGSGGNMLFFNKDMFEQHGITDIYELVETKQWTWEKFEEVVTKLTQDTDGNGTIDIWGYSTHSNIPNFSWIYSNGGKYARMDGTTTVSTLTEENVIETLQFLNRLSQVNKVVEWPTEHPSWDYSINQFKQGKAAMINGGWWLSQDLKASMSDKFGVIPYPIGPKMDDYVFSGEELQLYVVPAHIENPEQVLKVIDEYMQPLVPADESREADIAEAASHVYDAESVETYKMIKDKFVFADHHTLGDYWGTVHWAINAAIGGEKSPQALMEEATPAWENSIKERSQ